MNGNLSKNKPCYIICGGPEGCKTVNIPKDSFTICADSGYEKAVATGIVPDLLIGDFDSISSVPNDEIEIIKAPVHKDYTDTMLAVKTAQQRGYADITLVGACMGRTDHTLANIQTLKYMAKEGLTGRICGDNTDAMLLSGGSVELFPDKSRYLSVFSLSEKCEITIENAEYPLEHYVMTDYFPIGVSNKFTDKPCKITVYNGEAIILSVKK
ncbi:MAG: thiamine diphosphokinase [Eubacterium sp.]|nr:thiamine diphosphokinase [Eubacterium sp.]